LKTLDFIEVRTSGSGSVNRDMPLSLALSFANKKERIKAIRMGKSTSRKAFFLIDLLPVTLPGEGFHECELILFLRQ
jgi:hypothetical protein